MNKKIRLLIFMIVILVMVCNVTACGWLDEAFSYMGFNMSTKPVPSISYSKVTKISFYEVFAAHSGGRYLVDVTATRDRIQFKCIKGDVLKEHEEEITERDFECGQNAWDKLIAIFNDNNVNTWKEQGYYLDKSFNQQATLFEEWPEVEFIKEGDFFNITNSTSVFNLTYLPCYYGIDQNEKNFRSDYYGSFKLYTNNDESPFFWRAYDSYGLPKEYNHFRNEFWDFIVGQTGIADWRFELGDWGRKNLYKKYPYMLQQGQEGQIRYFSLLENYGGKESAMGVSLVYDGGEQSILYKCCSYEKIYSVGKSRLPVLYCERASVPIWKLESETEVSAMPKGLLEIVGKYKVNNWETESIGTEYVCQGEFYNIENVKRVKDKNEQVLRSGYDALIHVVYTDGNHVELWLENGRLPEAYNDFRDELWDYMLSYMNEGKADDTQVVDWRDLIDQWGEEYLRKKYQYIR